MKRRKKKSFDKWFREFKWIAEEEYGYSKDTPWGRCYFKDYFEGDYSPLEAIQEEMSH